MDALSYVDCKYGRMNDVWVTRNESISHVTREETSRGKYSVWELTLTWQILSLGVDTHVANTQFGSWHSNQQLWPCLPWKHTLLPLRCNSPDARHQHICCLLWSNSEFAFAYPWLPPHHTQPTPSWPIWISRARKNNTCDSRLHLVACAQGMLDSIFSVDEALGAVPPPLPNVRRVSNWLDFTWLLSWHACHVDCCRDTHVMLIVVVTHMTCHEIAATKVQWPCMYTYMHTCMYTSVKFLTWRLCGCYLNNDITWIMILLEWWYYLIMILLE